ncbi:hypothetical protein EJ04DRAFT_511246 [Polyplosphaeria fusca]|uniref:Uncharacterized protein n=1 Tax=Polyplosphaeria fusca TaxID=682080 RepID=A0A9P4QY89_9PLEO|nr:hypothetical protein EJ04DRAFT_511246 [Polyplosphaeria fusca]
MGNERATLTSDIEAEVPKLMSRIAVLESALIAETSDRKTESQLKVEFNKKVANLKNAFNQNLQTLRQELVVESKHRLALWHELKNERKHRNNAEEELARGQKTFTQEIKILQDIIEKEKVARQISDEERDSHKL